MPIVVQRYENLSERTFVTLVTVVTIMTVATVVTVVTEVTKNFFSPIFLFFNKQSLFTIFYSTNKIVDQKTQNWTKLKILKRKITPNVTKLNNSKYDKT